MTPPHHCIVFGAAFATAAAAGLAALLRGPDPLTGRRVASAVLNTGMLGLGLGLLWYTQLLTDAYTLVGMCLFAGLAGMPVVTLASNFVTNIIQRATAGPGPAGRP